MQKLDKNQEDRGFIFTVNFLLSKGCEANIGKGTPITFYYVGNQAEKKKQHTPRTYRELTHTDE